MSLDSLIIWAAHFGAGERIEFVCAEAGDVERGHRGWKPIRVSGCVAELGTHLALELLALGVAEVGVRRDRCADAARLDGRLTEWEVLFGMAGHELATPPPGRRKRVEMAAERMPIVERRSLFGLGRKQPRSDDAWMPDLAATHQQRIRAALAELGATPTEEGRADGVGLTIVADGCRASGQCVTACPHDALRLVHTSVDGTNQLSRLMFDASLCDSCGRCIEFCDARALAPTGSASYNDLLDHEPVLLATLDSRRCERCRAAFVPDGDATLCPVCAERRANPFGSTLPPEAIERLGRMREGGPPI